MSTEQAFSRFAGVVAPCMGRWLARWCVPEADRADVSQDTLLRAYECRDAFDPAMGPHVPWAYGIFGGVVRNYRRTRARRIGRVEVAEGDLPDIVADSPSPEEEADEALKRALFDKCLAGLDTDSRAILLAKDRDEIPMPQIAIAHGISETTARSHYHAAREQLQKALDREQNQKRAVGLAVVPVGLDQLLASEPAPPDVSAETMARVWRKLDRVMAADTTAGRLGHDGTAIERYMGVPNAPRRLGPLARALRVLLDPRVLPALTGVVGAAGGAAITYAIVSAPPPRPSDAAVAARPRDAATASVGPLLEPTPSDARGPDHGAPAPDGLERRADAGLPATRASGSAVGARAAELRPDAGPAAGDDIAAEQALYEAASTLYQEGKYPAAIEACQQHANEHPGGRFAAARDRLWTLALIHAGRQDEARRRIERLRRANPASPLLREFDEALSQKR